MFKISTNTPLFKVFPIKISKCFKFLSQIQVRSLKVYIEQKIIIDKQVINYVRVGNGSHPILCCPGAVGTIWTDFKPQIEGLDKNKFTIVVWEPPGYGKSRPPNRKFTTGFHERDADVAALFMEKIGIKKYSLLGWSDGGMTSMILAAKYPENIKKLVIWGSVSYVTPKEIKVFNETRDISKWSNKMKAPLIELYGEDGLQEMWNGWCDALEEVLKNGGNICKDRLAQIKCPTLILHGNKDPRASIEQPKCLQNNITGSKFYSFPEGKHNTHLRYAEEFNAVVTRFLLSNLAS